jgi:argininosuccinate synthase
VRRGRPLDLVEDRLVGIKSARSTRRRASRHRRTHQELENVTGERDLRGSSGGRPALASWCTTAVVLPLKRALDGSRRGQRPRHGEVRLVLHGGRAVVSGRRSPESLYDFSLATYDEGDTFDQTLAKGFVELWGLPSKTAAARDQRRGPAGG